MSSSWIKHYLKPKSVEHDPASKGPKRQEADNLTSNASQSSGIYNKTGRKLPEAALKLEEDVNAPPSFQNFR